MTARDFIDRLVGGHLQDHGHGEAERLGGPPTRTWWGLRSEPSRCPSIVLVAGRAGSTWAHGYSIISSARAEMDFGVAERHGADDRGFP